ncbi:MAG: FitA-like ribbon-helix-helix domain-containing protein [Thermoleophilia bacterium]
MANLTIRGLDEAIMINLRLEAARRGHSMEETARQILRSALIDPEEDAAELVIPGRSMPRPAPDFADIET